MPDLFLRMMSAVEYRAKYRQGFIQALEREHAAANAEVRPPVVIAFAGAYEGFKKLPRLLFRLDAMLTGVKMYRALPAEPPVPGLCLAHAQHLYSDNPEEVKANFNWLKDHAHIVFLSLWPKAEPDHGDLQVIRTLESIGHKVILTLNDAEPLVLQDEHNKMLARIRPHSQLPVQPYCGETGLGLAGLAEACWQSLSSAGEQRVLIKHMRQTADCIHAWADQLAIQANQIAWNTQQPQPELLAEIHAGMLPIFETLFEKARDHRWLDNFLNHSLLADAAMLFLGTGVERPPARATPSGALAFCGPAGAQRAAALTTAFARVCYQAELRAGIIDDACLELLFDAMLLEHEVARPLDSYML